MITHNPYAVYRHNVNLSIAEQTCRNAINKITTLTDLSYQQSVALLQKSLIAHIDQKDDTQPLKKNVLQESEHQFIAQLFH